ncbi:MAG TPA: ParB N-terminal domain-containing protein [Polyangiaceae bacterium]|nr:ParB N-terminal domain-containing protein [Polyangiaceae bacterium]
MAAKKTSKRKPRGVTIEPTGLGPDELLLSEPPAEVAELAGQVRADGGQVLAVYREPLGAHTLLLVALPIEKVKPTPFQRDVSEPHVKKLVHAMDKTKRFLDPIIAVHQKDIYFTPNGSHRLTALGNLGARSVIALLVPEFAVAYQILALNIEKAHTLRERALEVARMYRDLAGSDGGKESDFAFEFEEPTLATLGFAYEARPRLAGGAYHPALRKVDAWFEKPLAKAVVERQKRADLLLDLDDAVSETVAKLKAKGLTSPYLKNFVVARVNPLRFIKGELPSFEELLATMTKRAKGMNVDKINAADLARSGGTPDDE